MAQITWHESPDDAAARPRTSSSQNDLWFGITIGLIGLICGYIIGSM